MSDAGTPLPATVRERIDAHLVAIDRAMASAGVMPEERASVVRDVEAHVLDLFASRFAGRPTLAEAEAALAELDPPEAFGRPRAVEPAAMTPSASAPPPPRLSRAAVWGAAVAPLGMLLVLGLTSRTSTSTAPPSVMLPFFMVPLLLVSAAAPFATTILGLVAISQIRHSGGRIYGLPLAVADALLYPLLVLDVLLLAFGGPAVGAAVAALMRTWGVSGPNATGIWQAVVVTVWLVVCVVSNAWIIRRTWRAASTPVAPAVPGAIANAGASS